LFHTCLQTYKPAAAKLLLPKVLMCTWNETMHVLSEKALLLLLLLLLLSTFIKCTFAGCHKCAKNSYTLNNNDLSLFLNVIRVMSGDLIFTSLHTISHRSVPQICYKLTTYESSRVMIKTLW